MNREIKFRGKCLNSNEWVEGFYVKNPDVPAGQNEHEVLISDGYECTPVVSSTVGQFTGLHDKNGREIYEGDVTSVEICDSENGGVVVWVVVWADAYAEFRIDNEDTYFNESLGDIVSGGNSCLSIIGNIHDNPDLIKTKQHENQ